MAESSRRITLQVVLLPLPLPLLLLLPLGIVDVVSTALPPRRELITYDDTDYDFKPYAPSSASDDPPAPLPPPPLPSSAGSSPPALTPHVVVVAADGTGDYTTISDAVGRAPSGSAERFVIRIKAGVYRENVVVPEEKEYIAFVGDGANQTVLTSDRSDQGGWDIDRSPTLVVLGKRFLARDMTIENSAGPGGEQAVALRSRSDQSVFYRCAIKGYQDTLYVEEGRQFFRECEVDGTIDFIFGYASAVLQSCHLLARRPLPGQEIAFTAQGREDRSAVSGIVVHKSVVAAAADLQPVEASFRGFLGRPWKQYSTTVVMQSYLGGIVDPSGWMAWNGSYGLDTLTYIEYGNSGPGANTSRRVNWPGFKVLTDPAAVGCYTVSSFIQGDEWLPATGVPYADGLD